MSKSKRFSEGLELQFQNFLQNHSPRTVSSNLRTLLLHFLHSEHEHGLPYNQQRFINAMHDLFDLLQLAMKERGDLGPLNDE
jgi:hypothetical protein